MKKSHVRMSGGALVPSIYDDVQVIKKKSEDKKPLSERIVRIPKDTVEYKRIEDKLAKNKKAKRKKQKKRKKKKQVKRWYNF